MTTDTNQAASLGQILTTEEARGYLDPESTNARWREIDLADHGAAAIIVWRMAADTERSPEEEARAERLVACWNACQGLPTATLNMLRYPAWEPLTPEVRERLNYDDCYWVAVRGQVKPFKALFGWRKPGGCPVEYVFFTDGGFTVPCEAISHIMPFVTPSMPGPAQRAMEAVGPVTIERVQGATGFHPSTPEMP